LRAKPPFKKEEEKNENTGNRKIMNTVTAYSFIAPNLVGFSIFTLLPMGFALVLGFMQWNLADNTFTFVRLDNFARMRTDHLFWPSLRNTLYFTVVSVPLTIFFSLGLALLLNNRIKGRALFRQLVTNRGIRPAGQLPLAGC